MKIVARLILLYILTGSGALFATGNGDLSFRENRGQWPAEVLYGGPITNGFVFFTSEGLVFNLCDLPPRHFEKGSAETPSEFIKCHSFKLNFNSKDLNRANFARGEQGLKYNYMLGSPDSWAQNIKAYSEIHYREIYPGVDLRFYSEGENLKYDLILAPHADLNKVQFTYEGLSELRNYYGNLKLVTSLGEMVENIPLAYSRKNNRNVECSYELDGNSFGFAVKGDYDNSEGLVIDPILIFSTFSGALADNWGSTATYDKDGNLYSGGISNEYSGGTFPATIGAYQRTNNGLWDVAITKYDSLGKAPIYSTLIGGSNSEMVQSLVVNSRNELVIMGITSSPDFPVTNDAAQGSFGGGVPASPIGVPLTVGTDIFVAVLSANGSQLVGSTFLGGSANDGLMLVDNATTKNYGDESRGDVYTDEDDNIFIASKTASLDFPVKAGFQQVFGGGGLDGVVVKFNEDVSDILWSTYIGGTFEDAAYSIKKNDLGQIVVAGGTTSNDIHSNFLNAPAGDVDGWVAILEEDGSSLIAGRYMGTPAYDQAYFVDIDPFGNIYLLGQSSGDYPIEGNVYNFGQGQFIQKYTPDLSSTLLSTRFGSSAPGPDISPTAFLVNDCGNIYVSGWGGFVNQSRDSYVGGDTFGLPVTNDALQPITSGSDFYLMVFIDDAAALLYATYFGGNVSKTHVDGGTSRFDPRGIVYHAVCAGCQYGSGTNSSSSDFPTTSGAWSRTNNSPNCNNAAFKFDLSSLKAGIQTNTLAFDAPNIGYVCMPDTLVFENISVGGEIFQWDFGDGRRVVTTKNQNIQHAYLSPGNYKIKLKIIDYSTCAEVDSTFTNVKVYQPFVSFPEDAKLCEGDVFDFTVTGANSVTWWNGDSSVLSTDLSFNYAPDTTSIYAIEARYEECIFNETLRLEVVQNRGIEVHFTRDCKADRNFGFHATVPDYYEYYWDFGDGQISSESEVEHNYEMDGNYTAQFIASYDGCSFSYPVAIQAVKLSVPSVFTPGLEDGKNDQLKIVGVVDPSIEIYNRWGRKVYEMEEYKNNWDARDVDSGTYYYYIKSEIGVVCKGWVQVIK